ncbi:MAG: hypothetical protein H6729_07710 [Deltaproteobacteria bacterium]|nr:hypothetical protein [Deltaproteobacteria bacterium]
MSIDKEMRRGLLTALSHLPRDADQFEDENLLLRHFLPLWAHGRALEDDVMVVRGERGTGKTMLFRFLRSIGGHFELLGTIFPGARIGHPAYIDGFSGSPAHPSNDAIEGFAKQKDLVAIRKMWLIHLVGTLSSKCNRALSERLEKVISLWRDGRSSITTWGNVEDIIAEEAMNWLDALEDARQQSSEPLVVTYDHLDRIGIFDRDVRRKSASSLLLLWLSLSIRYRSLRAKIFIREDLFEAALASGADASKLKARSVRLAWDADAMYRMLIRSMSNQTPELRDWIQTGQFRIDLDDKGALLGWFPPEEFGEAKRRSFAEHLVGKYMGSSPKKGKVYTWLLDKLQDAHGAVAPRSLLDLIANAAESALRGVPRAKHSKLLTPSELTSALEATSKRRAHEVEEEHPVVARLKSLAGINVPVAESKVMKLLDPQPDDNMPDLSAPAAFDELLRIGVLRRRADGRMDVPDIYRHGFGIKRKGGTAGVA